MALIETISAIVALIAAALAYGFRRGKKGEQARQQARTVESVKQSQEVRRDVDAKSSDAVRDELASKWVRKSGD